MTDPVNDAGVPVATESTLSSWVGPYVTDMLGRGEALASQPYTPYTGPLTAGQSSLQQDAFSGIANLTIPNADQTTFTPTTFTSDGFDQTTMGPRGGYGADTWDWNTNGGLGQFAYNAAGPTGTFDHRTWTNPDNYTQYMSPFIQQALQPQLEEMARQADIQRLQDATRLTQAGAYGGSRQAIMESELNDNLARLQNETVGSGLQRAYESGMGQFNTEEGARREQFNIDRDVSLGQNRWENQFLADRSDVDIARRLNQFNLEEGNRRDQYNIDEDRYRDQFNLEERDRRDQFNIEADRDRNQFNTEEQMRLAATQANRGYGLDALSRMMSAGATQRGIEAEGIAADQAQFQDERDYPYRQVQYMQSLLQGLPLGTASYSFSEPSGFNQFLGTTGGIIGLLDDLGIDISDLLGDN